MERYLRGKEPSKDLFEGFDLYFLECLQASTSFFADHLGPRSTTENHAALASPNDPAGTSIVD